MTESRPATEADIREASKLMRVAIRARIARIVGRKDASPETVEALGIGAADNMRRIAAMARAGKLDRRQLFSKALSM